MEVIPGSKKGDHYGSVMFRGIIQFNRANSPNEKQSVIMKMMPFLEGVKKDLLESSGLGSRLFRTEIKVYNDVIPNVEKSLQNIGDETKIFGNCLHTAASPSMFLIFDDLAVNNYKAVDSWGGNWEVGLKTIEKLAKWHAITYKYSKDGNEGIEDFKEGFFNSDAFYNHPMFKDGFNNFLELLKEVPELNIYVERFEKIAAGNPLVKSVEVFKGEKANVLVLNHGDCHIKNVLIRETEDGHIEDVRLVDFQLSVFGPAVIDLIEMLYTFFDEDCRFTKRDEILQRYFSIFIETLEKLKYDGVYPKLTDLYQDFKTYKDFGIYTFIFKYLFL